MLTHSKKVVFVNCPVSVHAVSVKGVGYNQLIMLDKILELANSYRMAQFVERSLFDLSDSLSANAKRTANLVQSMGIAIINAESQADDLCLAFGEAAQNLINPVQKLILGSILFWRYCLFIFDKIGQVAIFRPNRCLQRNWMPGHLKKLLYLLCPDLHLPGYFLHRWGPAQSPRSSRRRAPQFLVAFDYMNRQPDYATIVGNSARY